MILELPNAQNSAVYVLRLTLKDEKTENIYQTILFIAAFKGILVYFFPTKLKNIRSLRDFTPFIVQQSVLIIFLTVSCKYKVILIIPDYENKNY